MKNIFYLLVLFIPTLVCAQQVLAQSSPLNYAWKNVGNAGFSAGTVQFTSLGVSPSGQPYVAYSDKANSWEATVMKYDSIHLRINESKKSRLSLYPNPASDNIIVETSSSTSTQSQLSISNINGQCLITRSITQPSTNLDISNLPGGVYFVRLTSEISVATGKFIKQ